MRLAARIVAASLLACCVHTACAQPQTQPQLSQPSQLDKAEDLIEQHEFPAARQMVMQALATNPKDTRALYDLGFVEYMTDHYEEAEQDYRQVLELNPALPQVHLALARLLLQIHREQEARQQFHIVAVDVKASGTLRGEAWRALAGMDVATAPSQARQDLLHALEVSPESPDDTLMTGQIAQQMDDPATAEQAYRKLIQAEQKVQPATVALAGLLLRQKRYADAVTLLQPGHAAFAENAVIAAQLGTALAATGKMQDALPLLQQAHETDPTNTAITRMLANVSNETGHASDAEPLYLALLKDSPKDPQLLASYGACLVRQKRYFEAEPPLQEAVQIKPDLGDAWGSLAFADSKLLKFDAVIHDLSERRKTLADNASTYFLWASAYDRLRRTRQAAEYYKQFLSEAKGQFPDQEFQVRERLKAIERTGK